MRRASLAGLIGAVGLIGMARAQVAPETGDRTPPPSVVTHLHLTAEGSASVSPDELVAELVAQATSASAVDAQTKVNALMKRALEEAATVAGVVALATGYAADPVDLNAPVGQSEHPGLQRPGWQARQVLVLRSPSGDRLLDLVGKLQGEGLTVSGLNWQLSAELRRKAQDAAMAAALKELQIRAAAAASVLTLRLDHIQDVQVNMRDLGPARPMMALRAAVPPQATPAPQAVTSEASADIVLRP